MTYIGIDPGKTGALVIIGKDGVVREAHLTPVIGKEYNEGAMANLLRVQGGITLCALEKVHAMPGQGVTSMFSFGMGFGLWRGMLAALGIPYVLVRPQEWQKGLHVPKGLTTKERKGHIVAAAMRRWPELELPRIKDWAKADAVWIAEWARKQGENE